MESHKRQDDGRDSGSADSGGAEGRAVAEAELEDEETEMNQLDEIMEYAQKRRREYAEIAKSANKRGMEAQKLSADSRELAYFDVMKEIERIQLRDPERRP